MFVNKIFPATAHKYGHLLLNNADIDIQCITYWIVSWNYSYSFLSHKCSILTDHSHRTEFTQRVLVFIYILVCARHLAFKPNFHWSICSAVCYFYNYRSDVTSNCLLNPEPSYSPRWRMYFYIYFNKQFYLYLSAAPQTTEVNSILSKIILNIYY